MTKNEAQETIKELQKFIEEITENNHPPYKSGQIYRHKNGYNFIVIKTHEGQFRLIHLDGDYIGSLYSSSTIFCSNEAMFDYVGMFGLVFKNVVA